MIAKSSLQRVVLQTSVLTSRKSSSTPSLSDVNESKRSVAETEQAASAENVMAKAVRETSTMLSF